MAQTCLQQGLLPLIELAVEHFGALKGSFKTLFKQLLRCAAEVVFAVFEVALGELALHKGQLAGVQIRQFLQGGSARVALVQAHHALQRAQNMVLNFFVEITDPGRRQGLRDLALHFLQGLDVSWQLRLPVPHMDLVQRGFECRFLRCIEIHIIGEVPVHHQRCLVVAQPDSAAALQAQHQCAKADNPQQVSTQRQVSRTSHGNSD